MMRVHNQKQPHIPSDFQMGASILAEVSICVSSIATAIPKIIYR